MSKKKKKVKGRREEKGEEHEHDYLNGEADIHGHPIEALDQIDKKTENFFDIADYFFELIDTDKEREMVKIRYVIEDWIDKEDAQRLIAKIQSE